MASLKERFEDEILALKEKIDGTNEILESKVEKFKRYFLEEIENLRERRNK